MSFRRYTRIFYVILMLLMCGAGKAWALSEADIIFDPASPVGGTVAFKSIDGQTVTITVTPASGYYVKKSDIVVQKLVAPSAAQARRRVPGIANALAVSGPSSSNSATDYTFVVPADYAGALVTVTFTGMSPATATVSPNSLTYTGEAQELVTLETVVGGAATNPVTYSLSSSGTYTTTIPTGTNAGTYTVYYKVAGDDTHAEGSGSVTVTIQKAALSDVTLVQEVQVHTGSPLTFTVSSVKAGTVDVPAGNYTVSGNTQTDVGNYTLTVTAVEDASHFNFTGSATASYRIVSNNYKIINSNTSVSEVTNLAGNYILEDDVNVSVFANLRSGTFTGTLDGNFHKITGLTSALFNTINGGTVKNVMLDNVTISSGTNVGAICNEATGASRIYNCGVLATNSTVTTDEDGYTEITSCSSTISGSGYVGGIVGLLDGTSRVINCFSYADIKSGSEVGGIVGHNNVATTSANLATMVMNCMFYGDIDNSCTSKAPIYNGEIITNRSDASGVSNFNYFRQEASFVRNLNTTNDKYNCALAAETRYLQRFEFFRNMLNSNRALAAWWATGNREKKDSIAKWVLEPSQIGTATPYPILKAPGKYPSVVNIDAENAEAFSGSAEIKKTQYNQGRKFGTTFTINIQMGTSGDGYHPPVGAQITKASVTRNITDKDPAHFNFNYYKVQLPYYNDVGSNNYTKDSEGICRVVTGWKIVTISGGTHSFSTSSSDASASVSADGDITLTTPYNFADRKCTDKDKYSVSGRVFSQGAYFDVPEGVTSITIEPYWAKCVYVSDQYPDVVFNQDMGTKADVTTVGGGSRYTNGTEYSINGINQKVYTKFGGNDGAIEKLNPSGTVYDNAIVLVGNVHGLDISNKTNSKPYTIMSIDLDKDNEPDYSYILRFGYTGSGQGRVRVHPVRIDFLNVIGLGMAQKSHEGKGTYNFGIMQPYGWFECTNTGLFRVTQIEYDRQGRTNSPMILHGGVIEQWVTYAQGDSEANAVEYYHVGGNVWFKEFHIGQHQDRTEATANSPHPPISVTGGDYDEFYLTGLFNTECYINGGRFGKVAGTGMQGIGGFTMSGTTKTSYSNGNIIWQIDNADIDEFYAGGMNAAHIAEGSIWTVITNSRVDQFCGGPKFGDMNTDQTVVTNATNCTFRTFFGAGYGGNSYNRRYPDNQNNKINIDWDAWLRGAASYDYSYSSDFGGVETRIDYQFIPMSDNETNVCRLFVDYVSFSLATTRDVTSKLTGCTITKGPLGRLDLSYGLGNFYGSGSLGKVAGPVKSTLTNCTVEGNVFGAGYSATKPTVAVMNNSFQTQPHYDENLGAYLEAKLPSTVSYSWEYRETVNSTATAVDTTAHKLYTTVNLNKSNLGSVAGNVTLTLTTSGNDGKTTIGTANDTTTGHVYGGGEESYVTGSGNKVTVNLKGKTEVLGNVYGGGDRGVVEGNTEVNIEE
jgi:hypothetical protein